jgi:hypothetical protein
MIVSIAPAVASGHQGRSMLAGVAKRRLHGATRLLIGHGYRPLGVLLIIAVVSTAYGTCFKAAAEAGFFASGGTQVSSTDDSYFADQAGWRKGELSGQGFELFDPREESELGVPPSKDEGVLSLWFETKQGTFAMELSDREGQSALSWQRGRRREQNLVQTLVSGKCRVKPPALDGARVYGVIEIKKGPVTEPREIDSGQLTEYPADPSHRCRWPTSPKRLGAGTLLVVPSATGNPTGDLQVMRDMAKCALIDPKEINAIEIANRLVPG